MIITGTMALCALILSYSVCKMIKTILEFKRYENNR